MLSRLLRQLLFVIVHLIASFLVALQNVYHRIKFRKSRESDDAVTEDEINIILMTVPKMNKKLRHLVLMADSENHEMEDLARVVIWSLIAGVPYVSFYDITGNLKKREESLFLAVEKYKKGVPGYIKWSHRPDLNGYTNGMHANTVVVNVFTLNDGKPKIAQCVKEIAEGKIHCRRDSKEITAQELEECLSKIYPSIPDPDLILYSGPLCCTYGFLPWHIRLTEFLKLSLDYRVNIENYINALHRYSKCDQRFGK